MHETFTWSAPREVGEDDAVIQFGFKIANSVSQHVKASRCLDKGSSTRSGTIYDTWVAKGEARR